MMAGLLELFQICSQDVWNSAQVTIGLLVMSWTETLFCQTASFCPTVLDKVMIVPNFFHLRMLEATALGALQWSSFLKTFPRRGTLAAALLTTGLNFYAPIAVRSDINRHGFLSITSNQLNITLEMQKQSVKTSQRWTKGMKAPQNQGGFYSQKP